MLNLVGGGTLSNPRHSGRQSPWFGRWDPRPTGPRGTLANRRSGIVNPPLRVVQWDWESGGGGGQPTNPHEPHARNPETPDGQFRDRNTMQRNNQTKLDRAATRRAAQAAKENAQLQEQQAQEELDAKVEETRAATAEEIAAELDAQAATQGAHTEEQRETLTRIATIEAAKRTLRDYGLSYTIASDRTADREPCLCGCGQFPAGKKSVYCPGHDVKHKSALAGPRAPKFCQCGCGEQTKGGNWVPGHDAKYHSRIKKLGKQLAAIVAA
jgi:uncharacterized protein YchJ